MKIKLRKSAPFVGAIFGTGVAVAFVANEFLNKNYSPGSMTEQQKIHVIALMTLFAVLGGAAGHAFLE